MIIVFQTFFGEHQPDRLDRKAHEAPVGMLIAPSILAVARRRDFLFPECYRQLFVAACDGGDLSTV